MFYVVLACKDNKFRLNYFICKEALKTKSANSLYILYMNIVCACMFIPIKKIQIILITKSTPLKSYILIRKQF